MNSTIGPVFGGSVKADADADGHSTQIYRDDVRHGHGPILAEYATDKTRREQRSARRRHFFRLLSLLAVFWLITKFAKGWYESTSAPTSKEARPHYGGRGRTPSLGNDATFDWSNHPPSKELNWTECYAIFQCARLAVPLDYSHPSGEEAAVALIRSASSYPPGHANYRGPILFNPGGPGGSGVELIVSVSNELRTVLGEGFDLVSFDPRGVGATIPALHIFQTSLEEGTFLLQFELNVNATPSSLGKAYANSQILGALAMDRVESRDAEHLSTPTVARDMLSIVEASGQEKLQYWGFSYGTVLGATFAAMFPDKVGRLIIDGVVDTENYYQGLWSNNLRDTDAALLDIYQSCVEAGPSKCALYENSTSLIEARVNKLLFKLRTAPLPLYDPTLSPAETYEVIDYALARQIIFQALYRTHTYGPLLTQALAALERGDGALAYSISEKRIFKGLVACDCAVPGESPTRFRSLYEALAGIACGDAVDREDGLEAIRDSYEDMAKMSSFAELWFPRSVCSGWKIRARERFNGSLEQTTSHPLLIIGNVADPVTPLWNAHKVSKGFKDSVVLTQNSSGHCSIAATSLCTMKAIRSYFVNGTLPEEGTVCQADSSIFGGGPNLHSDALGSEDRELLEASHMLQNANIVPRMGSMF